MLSLSDNNQADIIEAFNSASRYLDDLLNIDDPYFEQMVGVTIQNGWNNRISYGCVYAQIRSGLGMHLGTYSNHDTVLFLLIVPIKGRFV